MSATSFDVQTEKKLMDEREKELQKRLEADMERRADRAARELLSHPMRARPFFERCTLDFLQDLRHELNQVIESRQSVELAREQEQVLDDIRALARRMGISMDEALKGIKLD